MISYPVIWVLIWFQKAINMSHGFIIPITLSLPRVRILDSRMVHIDRQQKCCILHDGQDLGWVQRGKLGPAMEVMGSCQPSWWPEAKPMVLVEIFREKKCVWLEKIHVSLDYFIYIYIYIIYIYSWRYQPTMKCVRFMRLHAALWLPGCGNRRQFIWHHCSPSGIHEIYTLW